MKRIYHFLSKDMKTRIRTVLYTPEGMPAKAVVQIAHGMSEHIDRYNEFALYLKNHGFIVVGHDHLGHGKSISSDNNLGYFSPRPSQDLINDMHQVRVNVQKLFPDKPYFMLGHSMGSYLLRQYLSIYGEGLDGALILGTGYVSPLLARTGIGLAKLLALFKGWHYRSPFMLDLLYCDPSYRSFDLTDSDPDNSWLSKNTESVKAFYEDPACHFPFTLNGYRGLFEAVASSCSKKSITRIPKDLPILILSGLHDPVGSLGKGVKKVYRLLCEAGISDVSMKLYPHDRHEILQETDRDLVFFDIENWLELHLS